MSIAQVTLATVAIFAGAALLDRLAARLRMPATLFYLLAGFAVSEGLVAYGIDLGIRWYHFNDVVVNVLVPIVVATSVLTLGRKRLVHSIRMLCGTSMWLVCLTIPVTAAVVFFAIDHPTGFPWLAAFVAASCFAATDPGALKPEHETPGVTATSDALEAESTAGDVIAVSAFSILVAGYMKMGAAFDLSALATAIGWSLIGGCAVGTVFGLSGSALTHLLNHRDTSVAVLPLAVTLGAFLFCQNFGVGSGAIAALVTGLILASQSRDANVSSQALVNAIGWCARVLVFVLAGVTVTRFMFVDQWLAMLVAIAAATAARWFVIRLGGTVMGAGGRQLDAEARAQLMFGGGRGCLVLALALSLPLDFEGWYTIQSMAYGLVLFSLIVHPLLLRRDY